MLIKADRRRRIEQLEKVNKVISRVKLFYYTPGKNDKELDEFKAENPDSRNTLIIRFVSPKHKGENNYVNR